jgi:NADPH:quinone reductase-like Zn-dependent oxidoreductase
MADAYVTVLPARKQAASGEDGLAFAKRLGAAAVVDGRRADLVDAAKAHERMEAGHVLGKIVLRVRQRHGLR